MRIWVFDEDFALEVSGGVVSERQSGAERKIGCIDGLESLTLPRMLYSADELADAVKVNHQTRLTLSVSQSFLSVSTSSFITIPCQSRV